MAERSILNCIPDSNPMLSHIAKINRTPVTCRASWQLPGRPHPLATDPVDFRFRRKPTRRLAGLVLEVLPTGGGRIQVRLVHRGTRPLRVAKRLTWPVDLRVMLRRAGIDRAARRAVTRGGSLEPGLPLPDPAPIAKGMSWNGDRYERPGPLTAKDFGVLAPGAMLSRDLQLGDLVYGGLKPGRYEVQVTWTARSDGRHLGLAPARVGVLESEPVVVTLR